MLRHDCIDTMTVPVADSGALKSWKSWFLAGVNLLVSDMARIVETFALWQRRSTSRCCLNAFDQRLLRDIGVTREQASREVRKPFWRA